MVHIFCKMKSYITCKSNKHVWIITQNVSSLFVPGPIQCFLLLKTNNLHSEELIILHGMNSIKIISTMCLLYLYLSATSHITDTSCTCSIIFFIRMFQFNFISRIGQLVFALEWLVNLFEGTCPNSLYISKKSFCVPMGILKSTVRSWNLP
jgi:hypothetical protein